MSPSPRRLGETKKKQLSLDSQCNNIQANCGVVETKSTATDLTVTDGKFENISDNGSEISDEGYRSLGLVQQTNGNGNSGQTKRSQVQSQNSNEENAKMNGKLKLQTMKSNAID